MPIDLDDYEDHAYDSTGHSKKIKSRAPKNLALQEGRVISISPEVFHVFSDGKNYPCSLKGTLKKQLKQHKDRICCGDLILFDPQREVIEKLQERKSILMRENPSHQHLEQILATNVDQILITASVLQPELNPYLIDLYIISAQNANLTPIILINKIDLLKSKTLSHEAQKEKKLIEALKEQYQQLGITLICVSAKNLEGFKELQQIMKDKASVFSGESGVGKSSLINAIEKSSLKVGNVSSKNSKGMHTTTSSVLLPLKFGGWCVDTPGIQSLGFKKLSPLEIRNHFPELIDCGCKFSDCLHGEEKGCQIKEAIEKNLVHELRLASYYRLLNEASELT